MITSPWLPRLTLVGWSILLLVASHGEQSLMAHDEGWYATQTRWMVETGDWITPRWWGEPVFDRVAGLHWLIGLAYLSFGISDGVARLPSLVASVAATLLVYEIGNRLLPKSLAWMGAAILNLCSLWLQYSRMATQDIPLVCLELVGIFALLQVQQHPRQRWQWGMVAGSVVGLGFFIKSIMILLPIVALSPYLLGQRHQLRNPGLYVGLGLGFVPVSLWFWFNYQRYGMQPFQGLFGHLFSLGSKPFHHDAGWFYYAWNIPVNAVPWSLLAGVGLILVGQRYWQTYRGRDRQDATSSWDSPAAVTNPATPVTDHPTQICLLLVYPILLLTELTLFSTRTPYYALQLYPWIGLFAAVALDWLAHRAKPRVAGILSLGLGGVAIVILLAGGLIATGVIAVPAEITPYVLVVCLLAAGWLTLPWFWQHQQVPQWLAAWLITPWVALMAAGILGLWGNYSPELKATLARSPIVQTQTIDVIVQDLQPEEHKTWVLLSFYTPHLGQQWPSLLALPTGHYAWVSPAVAKALHTEPTGSYHVLARVQDWQLIHTRADVTPTIPGG